MVTHLHCSSLQTGEWVKGKLVGTGSFGTVHMAISKSTGSIFAVKSAQSEVGIQSLQHEASSLESLNSPFIVQYLGKESLNLDNGERKLNIFMEYIPGGSISEIAKSFGGISDEQVIRSYTRDILKGLKYLHGNGIVHCDIKCKNLLMSSRGSVNLADFGCAKRIDDNSMSMSKSMGGTPLWMAPEVLRNERLGFTLDIWSLGCTIIEMATGKAPWSDEVSTSLAAVLKIAHGDKNPQFPTQFSKEGLDFLGKCLERNPRKRWNVENLLNHPFISNTFTEVKKELFSHSPVSILDDGIFEAYEPDCSDSRFSGDKLRSRILPLLMQSQRADFELLSSENWVTVRS